MNEVGDEITPGKEVQVKIVANEKGSFILDLIIVSQDVVGQSRNIFTTESLKYSGTITTTVVNIFKLTKFLEGKKQTEIKDNGNNSVTITNNVGHVNSYNINATNVYLQVKT